VTVPVVLDRPADQAPAGVPPAGRPGPAGTAWPACTAQAVAVAVNQVHWLHYWDSVTRM